MKEQAPGFIINGISVGWKIKSLSAYCCPYLEYDWCRREKKFCNYQICPISVEGSYCEEEE